MDNLRQALLEDKEPETRLNESITPTEENSSLDGVDETDGRGVSFMDLVERGNVEETFLDRQHSLRNIPFDDQISIKTRAIVVQLLGVPFANNKTWWCRVLPLAILIGMVASCFSFIFLTFVTAANHFWFQRREDVDHNGGISVGSVSYMTGESWWIAVTTVGAFLANLVWLLPGAPSWAEVTGPVGLFASMSTNLKLTFYFVLHSLIGLSSGASAGPGMPLAMFGLSMGELVTNLLDERDQKLIMLSGFAACFSPGMPTPFHAVLASIELFMLSHSGNSSLSSYDTDRMISNPLQPGRYLHDHMEKICTIGFSAVSGYIVFRSFISYNIEDDEDLQNEADIETHHLFSAFILGIISAFVMFFFQMCKNIFHTIRVKVSGKLFHEGNGKLPKMLEPFLFPLLGGFFYGLIIVSFPIVAGGLNTPKEIITLSLNRTLDDALLNGYDEDDDEHITPTLLLLSCLFKLIGTAINLAWCWAGGLFLPLSTAGACLGAALDIWAPDVFPAKMAIPSLMVGITASVVPVMFTFMAIVASTSDNYMVVTCTFITGITGYTVMMGSGVIQKNAFEKIKSSLDKYNCEAGDDVHAKFRSK